MTRVHGICERAASPEALGLDAVVPDTVIASISFSPDHFIGRARLRRDERGDIWADVPDVDIDQRWLDVCPYFAVSAIMKPGEPAVIVRLAICEANVDPGLPRYEVLPE